MPPFYSSPTAIALWQLCPARAVAKYVAGFTEPETPAMVEGTRLHRIVQLYMHKGTVPATTEHAAHACIKVLPVKAQSIAAADIERVVLHPKHHGYLDWSRYDGHGDLKFTSNVSYQRAKNPETDPQRIIYAADAFYRDSSLKTLKQSWTVTQFDGKAALTLPFEWTKASADKAHAAIVQPIHDALALAVQKQQDWQTVEKNQSSCDMYRPNGCPMKAQGCKRSLRDRLLAIKPKVTK